MYWEEIKEKESIFMAREIFSKIAIRPKLIWIAKKVFEFLFTFSGYKNVRPQRPISQNNIKLNPIALPNTGNLSANPIKSAYSPSNVTFALEAKFRSSTAYLQSYFDLYHPLDWFDIVSKEKRIWGSIGKNCVNGKIQKGMQVKKEVIL